MEFLKDQSFQPPKNLYPCLATITIHPHAEKSRRLSTSSHTSGGEDDNVLKRIASGGRRKSDANERRKSLVASQQAGGGVSGGAAVGDGTPERGTWYWRVQAGVTENALILLPLTQPANSVLTSPPMPLSEAMPAHSQGHGHGHGHGHTGTGEDEGLVSKVKNIFRRGSAAPVTSADAKKADDTSTLHSDLGATQQGDKVIDQTARGEQLPSAGANAAGATNLDANAETGWPGVIEGQKLQAIGVPFNTIEKGKVGLSGGKKGEGYFVTVPITSAFGAMIAGFADSSTSAKSGSIRLEFDHNWIGAKGESELLHHQLVTALESRVPAQPTSFQLGQH